MKFAMMLLISLALFAGSGMELLAGDGNPTPTCIPGRTCGDQDQ